MTDATMRGNTEPEVSLGLPLPKKFGIGTKFSALTVLGRVNNDASGRIRLFCQCRCGGTCNARLSDLRSGHTKSCGCRRQVAAPYRHLILRRFGGYRAIGPCEETSAITAATNLTVGCAYCPKVNFMTAATFVKGKRKCECLDYTFDSYRNMVQRCENPNHPDYALYGGRGIKIAEEWREDFHAFASDMGLRPLGTTLDRRDTNGNYCKQNCRWATVREQNRNRRPRISR